MDIQKIKHLAELSKLEYSEEEMQILSKEFDSMIELADEVRNADISGTLHIEAIEMKDLREDIARKSDAPEVLLQNAPVAQNNCFVVNRIME